MPLNQSHTELQGVGEVTAPLQIAQLLTWEDEDRQTGTFTPYVLPGFPVNLWGQDILSQMGVIFQSPNNIITHQMFQQGFNPNKGLGKNQQERTTPIVPMPKLDTKGLGY